MTSDHCTDDVNTPPFSLADMAAVQREVLYLSRDDDSPPTTAGLSSYLRRAVRIIRRQSSWDKRCR